MFSRSAHLYDAIYRSFHDFEAEFARLHDLIGQHRRSMGSALLDVACGTGPHLAFWARQYAVEGLDLDPAMLAIANERVPGIPLHQADMATFDLGKRFDVIACLGSAIPSVRTVERLMATVATFARHLHPGGVALVEPFIPPEQWEVGRVSGIFVDEPTRKIARMHVAEREDDLAVLNFHYLVATAGGIEHFTELHELGLFRHGDYLNAFASAELAVTYDAEGISGRRLYIGYRPIGGGDGAEPTEHETSNCTVQPLLNLPC